MIEGREVPVINEEDDSGCRWSDEKKILCMFFVQLT